MSKTSWVYFSDTRCLWDENLRQSYLRVPEVMHELNKIQKENLEINFLNSLWFNSDFESLSPHWQGYLFNVMQRGMFNRLKKFLKTETLVVIRSHQQFETLLSECDLQLSEIELWLIGPVDDLKINNWVRRGLHVRYFLHENIRQAELI